MFVKTGVRHGVRTLLAAGLLVGLAACDGGVFDVEDPDNVVPAAELEPAGTEARFIGMVNDFREAYDDYALYTGLHTDEFILAGTFPTRIEVDARRPTTNNGSINGDVWQPLSVSRATADQLVIDFQEVLDDPAFANVESTLKQGIALGQLFGGYDRIFFAEFFCHSIFGGDPDLPSFVEVDPEAKPVGSDDRMEEALALLQQAEQTATDFDLPDVATAAQVGQARALLWLGRYQEAADVASQVPSGFNFQLEFSDATPGEENEVFQLTWAVNASLRWTVGDGTDASRFNERYRYLDEWLGQGLLVPPGASAEGGLEAFNGRSPVVAQTLYAGRGGNKGRGAPMVLASGWEARMIEAENMLRGGSPEAAQAMVNDLLEDPSQANNPILAVQPELANPAPSGALTQEQMGAFDPVDFTGDLESDLIKLARARAAGLWLTGQRQATFRRLATDPDLSFDRTVGGLWNDVQAFEERAIPNSISLPVPSQEVDNNERITQACPARAADDGMAFP